MQERKYVYRYRDHNRPGDGQAEVILLRRVIIKETEHYVWHVPEPSTWNGVQEPMRDLDWYWQDRQKKHRTGWYPQKVKKGGQRSAWHVTEKEALASWVIRKGCQLSRLRLQLERVELCINAAYRDGCLIPGVGDEHERRPVIQRVLSAPEVIVGGHGPEQDNYCWTEY